MGVKCDLIFFVKFTHILYFRMITAAFPDKRLAKASCFPWLKITPLGEWSTWMTHKHTYLFHALTRSPYQPPHINLLWCRLWVTDTDHKPGLIYKAWVCVREWIYLHKIKQKATPQQAIIEPAIGKAFNKFWLTKL